MIRAVIAARRGDEAASQAAWTRALNQAAFDQTKNRFIEIARAAEGFGATAAVEDAWVAAIRSGWGQLPLYRDVLPIIGSLATKSRTEDLLAVCRTLQRFEPQNPELANNVNYLGLLHGIYPPREAVRSLGQLAERHPEMPEIHSALILAELMAGSPEEAMRSMPKIQESPRVSPLMRTALEGSARLLLGETARGTELLRTVRWNRFMRQERIVFRDLLVKLKISGLPLPELEKPDATQEPELVPAWRKAVQQLEKDRAADILPALPAPRVPGADLLPGN